MAKSMLAGFVKGFAGRQLDNIDQRRKIEAEEKKARLLMQLQQETAEWEWTNSPVVKQSQKESESRIKENEAQAFRDQERLALDRANADFDQKLALRNAARMEGDSASERSYRERRLKLDGASLDGSQTGDSATRVAEALKNTHKQTVDSLIESGVDPLEIDDMTLQFVTDPRVRGNKKATGAELSKLYMVGLRSLRERQAGK